MGPEDNAQSGSQPIHWSAPSHLRSQRSVDWYWALGLIAVVGVAVAVWLGDILFAVIIALASFMLGIMAAREPREHEVEINERGIVIDHEVYPYDTLHSFWIQEEGVPFPRLYLETSGIMHPHTTVILSSEQSPADIRARLSHFIPEEERHSFGTLLAHWLGF